MKRPLPIAAISLMLASYLSFFGNLLLATLLPFSVCCGALILTAQSRIKAVQNLVTLMLVLLVLFRLGLFMAEVNRRSGMLEGRQLTLEGEVTQILSATENHTRFGLYVSDSDFEPARGITVSATAYEALDVIPGEQVVITANFKKINEKYKTAYFGDGYYYSCTVRDATVVGENKFSVWGFAHKIVEKVGQGINSDGDSYINNLLVALVIGDDSELSPLLNYNSRVTGVSHMLVVSGMHLGIVCGILMRILGRFASRRAVTLMLVPSVLFILIVCFFQMSVIRAAVAYLVMLASRLVSKDYDGLCSLSFGVIATVILFPSVFYSVAFMLSVTATYAVIEPAALLIKVTTPVRKLKRAERFFFGVWEIFAISFVALICTLPVSVPAFGYVSVISPLANLLVTFATNYALILGVLGAVLSFIPYLGGALAYIPFLLARLLLIFFVNMVMQMSNIRHIVAFIDESKNIYCILLTLAFILIVRMVCIRIIKERRRHPNAGRTFA